MKLGRFFVTLVVLLVMADVVACNPNRAERERRGQAQHDQNQAAIREKTSLVQEGNSKIIEAATLQKSLLNDYNIAISNEPKALRNQALHSREFSEKLRKLTKAQRHDLTGKLALFLQHINRALEIDAKNLITIDNRAQLQIWRDSATLLQKGIEDFERLYGEGYDPKEDAIAPPPRAIKASVKPAPVKKQKVATGDDEAEGFEEI